MVGILLVTHSGCLLLWLNSFVPCNMSFRRGLRFYGWVSKLSIHAISLSLAVDANCTGDVDLGGSNVLYPGQFGLFECTVNGLDVKWFTPSGELTILGGMNVGETSLLANTGTYASVTIRDPPDQEFGRRTSVLHYELDPGFTGVVNITCAGIGGGIGVCTKLVEANGECRVMSV